MVQTSKFLKESILSQTNLLTLESLHGLDDGLVAAAFNASMKAVVADMNDRPNDERAREIVVKVTLKPIARQGDLDFVKLSAVVNHKVPPQEGRECTLTPKRIGKDLGLLFATTGTDSRQPHLGFDDPQDDL